MLYGQLLPHHVADHVADAISCDAGRHTDLPLPHMDDDTVAAELNACVAYLDRAGSTKNTTKAAAESKPSITKDASSSSAPKRRRASSAAADAATPKRPPKGSRIEIYWEGNNTWFAGVTGPTRRCDGATHVRYDARDGWRAHTLHHVLADEKWRPLTTT